MALISIEDLEGLDEEQLDDESLNESQPMDEEDQDRLYAHWQAVGRTHQVSVPREMTGPIQEMTRGNHGTEREQVPYATLTRQNGDAAYEERMYPAGKWACISFAEKLYEQSISMGFMKLMRFICKENSLGRYLGMTVPILNEFQLLKDGTFGKDVLTAYYLPAEFQETPPLPTDPDISIINREPLRVITRMFRGTTTEETISRQIQPLWEMLGPREDFHRHMYMVAVYDNPGVPCRRNEIWFIHRNP